MSSENFDALWYEYEGESKTTIREWYEQNYIDRFPRKNVTSINPSSSNTSISHVQDLHRNQIPGGISPVIKERPKMGYGDNKERDYRSDQEKIDEAVREAIAKPRREAEIAKRIALVSALETLQDASIGTVFTFSKTNKKVVTLYAAIKYGDNKWAVTGDGYQSNGNVCAWSELLPYLTTGPDLAENIQLATEFAPVTAVASV